MAMVILMNQKLNKSIKYFVLEGSEKRIPIYLFQNKLKLVIIDGACLGNESFKKSKFTLEQQIKNQLNNHAN
ncbi:hypothetical protein BpHYR1_015265 [Brachionus plicatilis]|uniref:Uncharacterized protein n=1 Tax=Brachionus plicatilis TaxID=10195 RepID=A0A3M7Q2Z6_BRAPC|nr:hypothetical protein BpHYR1_015265 [Brachionus plicatilis]